MDRKQSIINTYLELGSKYGFQTVTLSQIAKQEQISKASFFSHYESFDALREQTESYCLNYLQNKEIQVDFNADNIRGLLVNLINSFIDTFAEEPLMSFCKMLDQLKLISPKHMQYSRLIDNMITARTTIALDFCVQRGWSSVNDTDSLALLITPFIRNLLTSSDSSEDSLDDTIKTLSELISL